MSEETFSHPEQSVRHTYPVKEEGYGLGTALKLLMKTSPYIIARLAILIGFTIGAIVWFGINIAVASLWAGTDAEGVGGFTLLVGLGLPAGLYFWLRRYVLYILKAGHIAVLTKLITDGSLPDGVNQVSYGKEMVTSRFGEVNILFVLDSIVTGVVRSFNRTLNWVAGWIPIPGLDTLMGVINKILDNATTYIDETIFSYNLARGDDNKWRSARDGLIYYAQNWEPILKTAAWVLVLDYALTAVLFVLFLAPVYGLSYVMPAGAGGWMFIFAFIFALCLRSAVLRPLFLTMVALRFHHAVNGQEINLEWSSKLDAASNKFAELTDKAKEWVASKRPQEQASAAT